MQLKDIEHIKNTPFFFIIGRSRSGTTMLRSMFDAHPNVIIPFESFHIFLFRRKYRSVKYWSKDKLLTFYTDLFNSNWKFHSWQLDKDALKEDLLKCEGKNDYETICKVVHSNYISVFEKEGIHIIGDKTPKNAVKLNIISEMFPDAKYIHIIRDYRDQLYSMLQVNFLDSIVPEILYQWKYSARMAVRYKKQHPDKMISIRYEDLVNNPAKGFSELCAFLGLSFHESCLNYYEKENEIKAQINNEKFNSVQPRLFNPIDNSRVNSWKGNLSDPVLQMADLITGKTGEYFSYPRIIQKRKLRLYIMVFLRLSVIRFYYLYRFMVHLLPYKVRIKIKNRIPALDKVYYFLFPKDRIKL